MTIVHRVRGDDWTITGTLAGTGSISGATIAAQLRSDTEAPRVALTFTGTVSNAASRQVTLTAARALTEKVPPGRYVYDIEVTLSGVKTTYGAGSILEVEADTTRAA